MSKTQMRRQKFADVCVVSDAFKRRLADAEFNAATRGMEYDGPISLPVEDRNLSSRFPGGPEFVTKQFIRVVSQ